MTELRRVSTEQEQPKQPEPKENNATQNRREAKRYRIKKQFDTIDRDEFRQKAFISIQEFFRQSINELNEIGDAIKGRFEKINELAFSCTVLNKSNGNREAHITVHGDSERTFGGDISYSFSRRGPSNTANGFIRVDANEYELFLKLDSFSFSRNRDGAPLSAEQAADALWREFTSQAGIDHE